MAEQNDSNWRGREDDTRNGNGYRDDYRSDRAGAQQSQFSDDRADHGQGAQMGDDRQGGYGRGDYGRPPISRSDRDQGRTRDYRSDQDRGQNDFGADALTGRDDARAGYRGRSAFGPSRYSDGSGGEFGSFNSQDYGGRDFQSSNRRTYSGSDMNYSAGRYGSSYNDQSRGFDRGYGPEDREPRNGGYDRDERGFFTKASDEVASWFGDDDAARRRDIDERRDDRSGENHRGRGPAGYTRSDQRILEDACEALTHNRMVDASNIQVTVDQGELTLDGTIDRRQAKRQAEDCVHDISGVKHVQNNLRIQERGGDTGNLVTDSSTTGSRETGSDKTA